MNQIKIMVLSKKKIKRFLLIVTASITGIYLLASLYFTNHFYFHTVINGANVSLKSHDKVSAVLDRYLEDYRLELIERDGGTETITGQEIGMQYSKNTTLSRTMNAQRPLMWIKSLFKSSTYQVNNLYHYDKSLLDHKIHRLKCNNKAIVEPKNVDFRYFDGSYEIIKEQYGNRINPSSLFSAIDKYLSEGKTSLDLNSMNCYENPKYTINSAKTSQTRTQLNKYVSSIITYRFGKATERLDGASINQWLSVDQDLEIAINKDAIAEYVNALSKKYNTVGIPREFQTSTGRKVELKGGLYGWKINREGEAEALYYNIKRGEVIEKEPVYSQTAFSREGNEIGNTYIEISITRQHLWFYKDGKLLAQGAVVTGNPNRNNATVVGAYMLNYKQKGATLSGPGYEAKVTYWMPFFGNMGVHDASWRYSFGGGIYKRNGTHGCVNAPLYLAKTIFENIEEGTPVLVYEED